MDTGPDGRRRVDVSRLPFWARAVLVVATIVLVSGAALLVSGGRPATLSWPAIVAALIGFAAVAWQTSR